MIQSNKSLKSSLGEFPKLEIKSFVSIQENESPEAKYWKCYQKTKEDKLLGAPSCIHFNPNSSKNYLVTASTKVSLYTSSNDKVQRSFSRFTDDAYSGHFRKDGKLIVAGDKNGNVKVFDVKSKAMLRQLKSHTSAVKATIWSSDGLFMLSGSDDKKVKRWDLGTQEVIWDSKHNHTDYVRSLEIYSGNNDMFFSGSYDHTVKLWDSRQENPVHVYQHDLPVESCITNSSGSLIIASSGNEIKLWDVIAGKMLHSFSNHQKNITSLCMNNDSSKLLSCGLDGHVKIYNMQSLQVVHGIRYDSPIVSIGLSPDNKKLIVGAADGTLIIRNHKKKKSEDEDEQLEVSKQIITKKEKRSGHENVIVETERQIRLRPYEQHLKKFNYQEALDCALKTRNPLISFTVLEELCFRNGLTIALSGRDETTLEPLLSFASRYINNPRYSKLLVQVTNRILDLYSSVLGHSEAIDELFMKLQKQIRSEVIFLNQVVNVMSALGEVMSSLGESFTCN